MAQKLRSRATPACQCPTAVKAAQAARQEANRKAFEMTHCSFDCGAVTTAKTLVFRAPAAEEDALDGGKRYQPLGEAVRAADSGHTASDTSLNLESVEQCEQQCGMPQRHWQLQTACAPLQCGPAKHGAFAHLVIHLIAHSALRAMQGMFSMAWNRCCFCAVSLMYVSSSRLYISAGADAGASATGHFMNQTFRKRPDCKVSTGPLCTHRSGCSRWRSGSRRRRAPAQGG